jgi:hypothetical protein
MDSLHYKTKEHFFWGLDLLISKIADKDEFLLNKIKEAILVNQHFISDSEDRKLIKKKLSSLKVQITQSRNNPRDRLLAYEILARVKDSQSAQSNGSCCWKNLPESRWEIKQFRKALLVDPEFNTHYEFMDAQGDSDNYLGRGREGIVYLAKEKDSDKLIAIKVKCERTHEEHPYSGEEEVKAVGLFSHATGYDFKAKNYKKFNAKNYIDGPTLNTLLKSHDFFDGSDKSQEIWNKLKEVLIKLILNKLFFADIAPENFIYDGTNFYLVDLRPFKICADEEETRKAYTNEILDKIDGIAWTQDRWYNSDCQEDKTQFVKFITQILNGKET